MVIVSAVWRHCGFSYCNKSHGTVPLHTVLCYMNIRCFSSTSHLHNLSWHTIVFCQRLSIFRQLVNLSCFIGHFSCHLAIWSTNFGSIVQFTSKSNRFELETNMPRLSYYYNWSNPGSNVSHEINVHNTEGHITILGVNPNKGHGICIIN